MAASIADVAERAGVSIATVSRALRGLPNVAPSTRARVLESAEELHYVVDVNASRLATGNTQSVGLAVPDLSQWSTLRAVMGAEAVLESRGYDVVLYQVCGQEPLRSFLHGAPYRKRVDALVCIDLDLDDDQLGRLAKAGRPVVATGLRSELLPTVGIDHRAAAATATRHLLDLGHTAIGFIGDDPATPSVFSGPRARRAGHLDALAAAGIAPDPQLEAAGNFSCAGGAEAMARLLDAPCPPTAVFAASDAMAVGALRTARDAGLRVPTDLSIVGFDDHEMAAPLGLTTVRHPSSLAGERAAELVLRAIGEHPAAAPTREAPTPAPCLLPATLEIRRTTAPRRTADIGPLSYGMTMP